MRFSPALNGGAAEIGPSDYSSGEMVVVAADELVGGMDVSDGFVTMTMSRNQSTAYTIVGTCTHASDQYSSSVLVVLARAHEEHYSEVTHQIG